MSSPALSPAVPLVSDDHGIVVALDVPTIDHVRDLVEATANVEGVVAYKLGPITALTLGLAAALEAITARTDRPVIYDHQKAGLDIPANADGFAAVLADHGVRAAIVFPLAGPTAAREYPAALRRHGVVPLVGGVLSVGDYVVSSGGWVVDDAPLAIADAAASLGETHLIAPPGPAAQRTVDAAARHGLRPHLFVPGIGASGDELDALADIAGPVGGIYPIVGRAITRAADPAAVADTLVTRLRGVIAARSTASDTRAAPVTPAASVIPAASSGQAAPGASVRDRAARVIARATAAGVRIATVETVTAGRLSSLLTEVPGASQVFERGFTLYHANAKASGLGIDPAIAEQEGAVSAGVTRALAGGLDTAAEAELGVAITGYAGPTGGTATDPVGTVYLAVYQRTQGVVIERRLSASGDRLAVREAAVAAALDALDAALDTAVDETLAARTA